MGWNSIDISVLWFILLLFYNNINQCNFICENCILSTTMGGCVFTEKWLEDHKSSIKDNKDVENCKYKRSLTIL